MFIIRKLIKPFAFESLRDVIEGFLNYPRHFYDIQHSNVSWCFQVRWEEMSFWKKKKELAVTLMMMMMMMMIRIIVFVVWLTGERRLALFSVGTISEILTIVNLRHTTSRIWNRAEPEFRLCWMKMCSGDDQYATASSCNAWCLLKGCAYLNKLADENCRFV